MARFRKSVKIAPGIKLNFSKSGVSSTFGVKGASVNVGKDGAYLNTGVPGTGISSRHKIAGSGSGHESESNTNIIPVGKTGGRVLVIISLLFFVAALIVCITGHPIWAFLLAIFGGSCLFAMILGRMAAKEESETN
jgi:hypothetical protein